MKVKVGDKVYDGNEQPVMVILEDGDKQNIANMDPGCTKYCVYPDTCTPGEIERFMEGP